MIQFSRPQQAILTTTQRLILSMKGVGSGKTTEMAIINGRYLDNFPGIHGMALANTYGQLNTATIKRNREEWKSSFNWDHGIDYVVGIKPPDRFSKLNHNFDSYDSIISHKNGSVLFMGSTDNYKAHDGKEVAFLTMDETKDTKKEAVVDVLIPRVRLKYMYVDENNVINMEGRGRTFNPIYFFTSPGANDYLNQLFDLDKRQQAIAQSIFSKTTYYHAEYEDKCVCISSTWHNEQNLPDGYIEGIIRTNPNKANALIYGDPFKKIGNSLYSGFDRYTNVGEGEDFEYKEGSVVHLSFDQNRVPYNTSLLSTVTYVDDVIEILFFDEFCPPPPNNNPQFMSKGLIKGHHYKMINGVFIYGDPQGQRKTAFSGEDDHYKIIIKELSRYVNNSSFRVQKKHPPVGKSVDFINNCLSGVYPNIKIKINARCKKFINDLQFLKQNKNGGKKIENDEDGFEKYGHTSDAFRYQLITLFWNEFKKHFLS